MDVLITGSTGMVGKSVLHECVKDKRVKNIYLINRSPVNLKSPKISELIISDFLKIGQLREKIKVLRQLKLLFQFYQFNENKF